LLSFMALGTMPQLGVGVSTVITSVLLFRKTSRVAPGKMGGHKPQAIAGECCVWLLQRIG